MGRKVAQGLAIVSDLAFGRAEYSGNRLKRRALACAIGTYERNDLVLAELE